MQGPSQKPQEARGPLAGVVARSLALAALAVNLLLAGCLADDGADLGTIPPGSPAAGPNAGSASDHGTPDRTEGAVTVQQENGAFVARQTVTLSNDFGAASQATVHLTTGAGGVTTRAWSEGGYRTVVLLMARADTESQARTWLDRLSVTHTDRLTGDGLALATEVNFPEDRPNDVNLAGTITATLPEEPSYAIELDAGSGGAVSTGLSGPSIDADTGSGGISIEGAFARIEADAGSGGIEVDATANSVDLDGGSGGIAARLRAGAGGLWTFSLGSGGLDLDIVRGDGDGFDIEADVGSGGLTVSLSDGEAVGTQGRDHAHVRSSGFAEADVQVRIVADTGSGGIAIHD